MTVVVLGDGTHVRGSTGLGDIVESVIEARSTTTYAEAIALAGPRIPDGSAVWLLAQDTVPRRDALQLLAGALERSPSAAVAAPKLVRQDDDREIQSLGVSMTKFGRSVELAAGELDQGQHDATEDALGADVRGMLIRDVAPKVLRPDVALGGADEGLDLGVRARLGGARVVLVPKARIGVTPNGPAALPRRPVTRAWVTRRAQLHRRLAYAPAAVVPLHWLSLLPLALWRSITHLIGKRPAEVAPEWGAAIATMLRLRALARSRAAIRSFRHASWATIAPLRVSRDQLRERLDDGHGSERGAVSELHFFGGGAWAVLAALVVSVAVFLPMLAWPSIGGGGLLPLHDTVTALWADAAWGLRDLGLNVVGPADPFSMVIALLGSSWPGSPSYALVLLWLAALPLAVLGGWFAATRVTDRSALRVLGGVLWALAPTFLTALVQGRPSAVILHLLLPWVFHSAVVAHRSWGAAGAASLLIAAALACAPSLSPAFVLLWALTIVLMLAAGRVRSAVRVLWLLIPAAVLFAPLIIWQVRHGDPWALLADPAVVRVLDQVSDDAAGRSIIAGGFPSPDRAGWEWFAGSAVASWAPLLLAPLALLALASALSPRWRAGFALLLTSVLGIATAMMSAGIVVSFVQGAGVALWPGTGLSLAWLGAVGAALVTLDTVVALTPLRVGAAALAGLAVAVCALPALLAVNTGHAEVRNASTSTLPALVMAQAASEPDRATLVMTPSADGSLSTQVIWGASDTLGAQSTMLSTATKPVGDPIAHDAVDLLSARDFDAAETLADQGISFVLVVQISDETDLARAMREETVTAIDSRAGFVKAGATEHGILWGVDVPIADRAPASAGQQSIGRVVETVQLIVVLAALLLAIPTRASRRAARARSRIVGRAPDEPIVLPPRQGTEEPSASGADDSSRVDPQATSGATEVDAPELTADAPENAVESAERSPDAAQEHIDSEGER
ncbi:glycosyl transferase [Microbacterium sp. H1-D42]|uniref:glycosyl transferase n=1 Tax=Microbacterium sp. H1-D42 TaxID=2925844 RepID=UPI001F539B20|nr:glycosyl transferase [Microbacterium sp. H1-D42]UNK69705.1 glycosyl transferase [Microbacterium sp. H1-D42]